MLKISPIESEDWAKWRSVRLRALLDAPDAFGSTFASASGENDREEYWRRYFAPNGSNYLADADGAAVGLVRITGPLSGAAAELMSLWVAPDCRGVGVARGLVEASWTWLQATSPGAPLHLSVRRRNLPARGLYARLGFTVVGPDPDDPDEDHLIRRPAR